jgi:hypothetical protein
MGNFSSESLLEEHYEKLIPFPSIVYDTIKIFYGTGSSSVAPKSGKPRSISTNKTLRDGYGNIGSQFFDIAERKTNVPESQYDLFLQNL